MPLVGGLTAEAKAADDKLKEICEKIKEALETKLGRTLTTFIPLNYKTQVVNGVNYFIKIQVEDNKHVHVRAHQSFDGKVTLTDARDGLAHTDEITYF